MIDTYDPAPVHEMLALAMLLLLLLTAAVAFAYVSTLGAFFRELKEKEPDVWQRIGTPTLLDMMAMPFLRFRKYYPFYPALQERAANDRAGYPYAGRAWLLLRVGLAMTALLFLLGGVLIYWMVSHDL
jgi:hypothetical protein